MCKITVAKKQWGALRGVFPKGNRVLSSVLLTIHALILNSNMSKPQPSWDLKSCKGKKINQTITTYINTNCNQYSEG